MGKARKKERKLHTNHHDNASKKKNIVRRSHSQPSLKKNVPSIRPQPSAGVARTKLRVPFVKSDHALCVGEGDFSFALSLAAHHKVKYITATSYDNEDALHQKYPHTKQILKQLRSADPAPVSLSTTEESDSEWNGLSPATLTPSSDKEASPESPAEPQRPSKSGHSTVNIHHGINATKLSTTHAKLLRPHAPFTKIVFNFPHVGGLSTDVNRQVRANQELLVGFFKAAVPLLVSAGRPVRRDQRADYGNDDDDDDEEEEEEEEEEEKEGVAISTPLKGQILATLFEGEPYSLWNVRDLARHCGLQVVESFRFPWAAYPGYTHARTAGEITRGKDRSAEGKRLGAWRGEEREARCFVLEVKDVEEMVEAELGTGANTAVLGERGVSGKRKRKGKGNGVNDSESD